MKNFLIHLLIKKMRANPTFKRKVKVFVIFIMVSFVFLTGGLIWTGVNVYRLTSQQVQAIDTNQVFKDLQGQIGAASALVTSNCWGKVQAYFNIQAWLTRPINENWAEISGACFSTKANSCEGEPCKELNKKNISDPEERNNHI